LKQARFYCDSIIKGQVQLNPDQAHHLVNVLRLTAGGHVELFDGKGTLAQAVITDITRKAVTLQVEKIHSEPAKLAIAAAKQCGRIFLPKITGPADLQQTLSLLKNDYPHTRLIFGAINPQAESIAELERDGKDIIAFVGPEGGLTQEEMSLLKTAGASEARLTDTTLRIETAAVAFAAVLCANRDADD
jgi:16S rRNA U1498 N3-methylase RsmE